MLVSQRYDLHDVLVPTSAGAIIKYGELYKARWTEKDYDDEYTIEIRFRNSWVGAYAIDFDIYDSREAYYAFLRKALCKRSLEGWRLKKHVRLTATEASACVQIEKVCRGKYSVQQYNPLANLWIDTTPMSYVYAVRLRKVIIDRLIYNGVKRNV